MSVCMYIYIHIGLFAYIYLDVLRVYLHVHTYIYMCVNLFFHLLLKKSQISGSPAFVSIPREPQSARLRQVRGLGLDAGIFQRVEAA